MKTKNRDQSLSDSRELDGSYDQLTGKFGTLFCKTIKHAVCKKDHVYLSIYVLQNILHSELHILLLVRVWHASMLSLMWMFDLMAFLFADLASYHSQSFMSCRSLGISHGRFILHYYVLVIINGGRSFYISCKEYVGSIPEDGVNGGIFK